MKTRLACAAVCLSFFFASHASAQTQQEQIDVIRQVIVDMHQQMKKQEDTINELTAMVVGQQKYRAQLIAINNELRAIDRQLATEGTVRTGFRGRRICHSSGRTALLNRKAVLEKMRRKLFLEEFGIDVGLSIHAHPQRTLRCVS